ncbi:hypothetical protein [Staphylococcus simulans]|nr:hypothetical protein [Staphylococcus simulans]UXV43465.1 hypothetical protein MUA12_05870 [Staphylococcus simulans]
MATLSFTTEYKFTAKTAPKLLKAIEQQENKINHPINAKTIRPVNDSKK